jgi:hypothetical protein
MEALVGLFLAFVGEVEGDHRSCELGMASGALDEPGIDPGFQQMGGVGMPQGMDGDTCFGEPGALLSFTEGALDTGATHGGGGGRTLSLVAPRGGKEPGGVPVGFPGGAEERKGLGGPWNVSIFGPLAAMDMDLETRAVNVRDLEEEGFLEPEAQARDGGEGDVVVERGGGRQESPHFLHTEDSGEVVGGLRAQERQRGPVVLEDVLREEAHTAGADTHGSWSEAVDVLAMQAIALEFLCREAVGGFVGELGQQSDFPDIGLLGTFTFAAELKRRNHLLTQWTHEISPFVRRVVRLRRKTS